MSGAGKVWNNQRFFNWIYRVLDATAAAKWLHSLIRTNISNINIFLHTSICHYSWNVLAKFDENHSSLYNLQLHSLAMPGDYPLSWNSKPVGQCDLLVSIAMDQDFPGKLTHCRHVYFFNLNCSGKRYRGGHNYEQSCQRQRQRQRQNPQQKWENCKMCWAAR